MSVQYDSEPLIPQGRLNTFGGLFGKPYVTISANGLANGKSSIFNDGADFGVDTYNTKTKGLQEAINYAIPLGLAIYGNGVFDITDAPFQQDGSYYAQLMIPAQTSNQGWNFTLIGSKAEPVLEGLSPYPYASMVGGITILSNATGTSSTASNNFLIHIHSGSIGGNERNPITVNLDNVALVTKSGGNVGGINNYYATSVNIGALYIGVNSDTGTGSTTQISTGIAWVSCGVNAGGSSRQYIDQLSIINYTTGIQTIGVHELFNKVSIDFMYVGILCPVMTGTYGLHINELDVQNTQTIIKTLNQAAFVMSIGHISIGDNVSPANEYIVDTSGATANTFISGTFVISSSASGYKVDASKMNIGAATYVTLKVLGTDALTTVPIIDANPPVSGTAYQNKNPYDIIIYLPAYATASGTAGTVEIKIGTTSTPDNQVIYQYVGGGTSSTSAVSVHIHVPAGWYYEITLTGVTVGTATVMPD